MIDLAIPNIKCELTLNIKDFPKRPKSITGFLQDKLIIGGGYDNKFGGSGFNFFKTCYTFGKGKENRKMKFLTERRNSSSIVLGDKIWIVGGEKPPYFINIKGVFIILCTS